MQKKSYPVQSPPRPRALTTLAIAAAACLLAAPVAAVANSNALWIFVHSLCVTDMRRRGSSWPCAAIDLNAGYAVVRDFAKPTEFLVVPTARVPGIESPALLSPSSPNYWQDAWVARRFVERRVGRPVARDEIGFAINSKYGRTQGQLHIHIDCVQPGVRQVLQADQGRIGDDWSDLGVELGRGHRYRAMRIGGEDLGAQDPFKVLADGDATARADMGSQTLAVMPMTFSNGSNGFVLLSSRADLASDDKGASEELLDHRCRVLKLSGPKSESAENAAQPGSTDGY